MRPARQWSWLGFHDGPLPGLSHAPSDPLLDFRGEPADSAWTQMDRPRESARRYGRVDSATPQSYESFDLPPPEELSRIAFRFHDSKLNHGMPLRLLGVSRELRPIFPPIDSCASSVLRALRPSPCFSGHRASSCMSTPPADSTTGQALQRGHLQSGIAKFHPHSACPQKAAYRRADSPQKQRAGDTTS
jgi:hypothetical protein